MGKNHSARKLIYIFAILVLFSATVLLERTDAQKLHHENLVMALIIENQI